MVQYLLIVSGCEAVSVFCSPEVPEGGSLGPHRSYWPVGLFLCGPWSGSSRLYTSCGVRG